MAKSATEIGAPTEVLCAFAPKITGLLKPTRQTLDYCITGRNSYSAGDLDGLEGYVRSTRSRRGEGNGCYR